MDELAPDDLVVLNDTRVLPVRLRAHRATGGAVEVLLLEPEHAGRWQALARPMRRLRDGETLTAGELEVTIEYGEEPAGTGRLPRNRNPGPRGRPNRVSQPDRDPFDDPVAIHRKSHLGQQPLAAHVGVLSEIR
jgi:hypothetical protein